MVHDSDYAGKTALAANAEPKQMGHGAIAISHNRTLMISARTGAGRYCELSVSIAKVRRACGQIGKPAVILFVLGSILPVAIQAGTVIVHFVDGLETLLE